MTHVVIDRCNPSTFGSMQAAADKRGETGSRFRAGMLAAIKAARS